MDHLLLLSLILARTHTHTHAPNGKMRVRRWGVEPALLESSESGWMDGLGFDWMNSGSLAGEAEFFFFLPSFTLLLADLYLVE